MPTPIPEYCTIPLTQGQVALVDAADFEWLNQWKWSALKKPNTGKFYAARHENFPDGRRTLYMNRLILGLDYGDKNQGDHRSMDSLDNRRANLRIADHGQNKANGNAYSNNKSGFKGVSWKAQTKRWTATIKSKGKQTHLGYFFSPEDAHAAYCAAATRLHGEFARFG